MVPNTAVIGLPDANVVEKYDLQFKSPVGVTPLDQRQTLTNASIVQENGSTILTFTKPLVESGERAVSVGENRFNWAIGANNLLGYHSFRGSSVATFSECS